jgi:hypothetical protein
MSIGPTPTGPWRKEFAASFVNSLRDRLRKICSTRSCSGSGGNSDRQPASTSPGYPAGGLQADRLMSQPALDFLSSILPFPFLEGLVVAALRFDH